MDFDKESDIFKALGHPVRLKIVVRLAFGPECNVSTMVEKLGIPQSTVSQHLGILKSRGIIASTKKGVETCYFLHDERIKKIIKSL
jgi:DNA-binding transcriptional ArsR family regulator